MNRNDIDFTPFPNCGNNPFYMNEFNRVAMKTAGQEMFPQIKRKSRNEAVVEGRFWAREVCFVLNGNYCNICMC